MNNKPNPEEWRVIDFDSRYATGFVWQRLDWLMSYDPFAGMFTDKARNGLCLLVVTAIGGDDNTVVHRTLPDINLVVRDALEQSAMGMMLTHQFKVHFISLVGTAVLAGSKDNGVLS